MLLTFTHEGATYEVDPTTLTAVECREIKRHTGMKYGALISSLDFEAADGMDNFDPDALLAMLWVAMNRAGNPVLLSSLGDKNVLELMSGIDFIADAPDPEADAEAAEEGKDSDGTPPSTSEHDESGSSSD